MPEHESGRMRINIRDNFFSRASKKDIEDLRDNFLTIVDGGDEHKVHSFLNANRQILRAIMPWHESVHPEYRLGAEHRADFVLIGEQPNIGALEVSLIELESPKSRLFTKAGDPTKELTHAIRQVRDWRAWIRKNRPYFVQLLPNHLQFHQNWEPIENFFIIIGRRGELTRCQKESLRAVVQEDGHSVMTYDTLIERFCRLAELI